MPLSALRTEASSTFLLDCKLPESSNCAGSCFLNILSLYYFFFLVSPPGSPFRCMLVTLAAT